MDNNQLVGTLCMDICINEEITLPKCITSDLEINDKKSLTYKFYLIDNIDSSFVVPIKSLAIESNRFILEKDIKLYEFEMKLSDLVKVI